MDKLVQTYNLCARAFVKEMLKACGARLPVDTGTSVHAIPCCQMQAGAAQAARAVIGQCGRAVIGQCGGVQTKGKDCTA